MDIEITIDCSDFIKEYVEKHKQGRRNEKDKRRGKFNKGDRNRKKNRRR